MAEHDERRDNGTIIRIVAGICLLGVVIAFVVANAHKVKVGFVVTDTKVPLIFVLIATVLIGALLDRLWLYVRRR